MKRLIWILVFSISLDSFADDIKTHLNRLSIDPLHNTIIIIGMQVGDCFSCYPGINQLYHSANKSYFDHRIIFLFDNLDPSETEYFIKHQLKLPVNKVNVIGDKAFYQFLAEESKTNAYLTIIDKNFKLP